MRFAFTEEEDNFRDEVRKFLKSELPNNWDGVAGNNLEEGASDKEWDFALEMRKKLGQNASMMKQVIFAEEMTLARAPGRDGFGIRMLAPTLMIHGTEDQKTQYLPDIAKGNVQWCQGYSEPESGSDLASLQTRAVEDGDDFVINGTKVWTSSAHRADKMFIMVRTNPEAPKHRGISFLLIDDMKSEGIKVNPIIDMAGRHNFNMVTFDNVRVPKKNLVGELNRGWYVGATLLDFERSGVEYSSRCMALLTELIEFATTNKRGGKYISEDPNITKEITEIYTEINVSRGMSYKIADMQSNGEVPNKESSMSKLFGTILEQKVAALGMQILGMYSQLGPESKHNKLKGKIEQEFLSTVSATIAAGTSEIQRGIIATRGLGLPKP
jgi:alkylation response protein AidB-like acyl-CoA dehydrogenase